MGALTDTLKGFGVTFSHMFKKVVTTEYPEKPSPVAPRYHGRHILNRHPDGLEKCIGCELCAWACPADAIYVEGGDNTEQNRYSPGERYASVYQINYARCIFCGLCIEACPTRSLTMSNEYELARDDRKDLIFTKEQLLAPLLPGMEMPPHEMFLGDSEKDYYIGAMTNPGTSVGAEMAHGGNRTGGRRALPGSSGSDSGPSSPTPKGGSGSSGSDSGPSSPTPKGGSGSSGSDSGPSSPTPKGGSGSSGEEAAK